MAEARSNKKNGLIELFRFLCSVWVAYYHGFLPVSSDKFSGVVVSVDFFFMVSGLFFLKSIEKYKERQFLEGVGFVIWGRTKKIIVPLLISAFSILLCNIFVELEFNGFNWPFSFLWFFAAQFFFLTLFYLLFKKTKSLFAFNICCVVIILIFMSMFRIGSREFDRMFRGPAMLAIGMLLSQIPKLNIKLKDATKAKRFSLTVNAVGFVIFAVAFLYLAYLPKFEIWKLHLQCCVVCPFLLYFATALPVYSKFLNLLGEFSVYIYLAQCPILLNYYFVNKDTNAQFPLFCVCIVAMFAINRIFNAAKTKFRKAL